MSNYPTDFRSQEMHMLFDIGYTYGLLLRCQRVLKQLAEVDRESADLVRDIEEFNAGRLQSITEIYDAAERLFKELERGAL